VIHRLFLDIQERSVDGWPQSDAQMASELGTHIRDTHTIIKHLYSFHDGTLSV
jgi:hypothetical protein